MPVSLDEMAAQAAEETDESQVEETTPASETTPQETEESAATPGEVDEEESGGDDDQAEETEPNPLDQLVAAIHEAGGADLRGKYESLQDALRGIAEATRLVGRRNDEAAKYAELQKRLGEEGIRALEQMQAKTDGLPTVEEYQRLVARAEKDPQAQTRLEETQQEFQLRAYQMARMLPQLQQMVELAQQGRLLTREEHAQTVQQTQTEQWIQAHRDELYANGQYDARNPGANLSAIGKQAAQLMQAGITDPNIALATAKQMQPKPPGVRKTTKRSRRDAPVAPRGKGAPLSADKLLENFLKQGGDLDGYLAFAAQHNAEQAED